MRGRSESARRACTASRGASRDSGVNIGGSWFPEEGEVGVGRDCEQEPDDEEYLYRERGYGLGMWIDRVIGWSLFSVDDEEDEEDIYRRNPCKEGCHTWQPLPQSSKLPKKITDRPSIKGYEDDAWGDPTWAFSIATQIFF